MRKGKWRNLNVGLFMILAGVTWDVAGAESAGNEAINEEVPLTQFSLQELQSIEVTTVGRKEENWLNSAAAIYVLTEEDIKRSGALHIPDALRMVPGFNVAQINANKWAISSRGLNNRFSNKMLVLMDGRTVYSHVFSGVHWDVQDTLMEDVDQIETIKGPGGSLWGANAVNGVISIQTKTAAETQGVLTTGVAGSEEFSGGIRYGGKLAENAYYRVYGKAFNRDDYQLQGGRGDGSDEWWQERQGFRVDWDASEQSRVTFQGDAYYGRIGDELTLTYPAPPFTRQVVEKATASGGNFLSRWQHRFSERADFSLQAYYDRVERRNVFLDATIDTYDLDFQNRIELGSRNELLWGAAYRLISDELIGSYYSAYLPPERNDQLFSLFLQDEITLVDDQLFLTLGGKLEHNDYTGAEFQPGAKLAFKPAPEQTAWVSVNRAVRTPARFEHDIFSRVSTAASPGTHTIIYGNPNYESEELVAYEAGYRIQLHKSVSLDLTTFYNDYAQLRSTEQIGQLNAGPPLQVSTTYGNRLSGEAYGFEFSPQWKVTEQWKIAAGYSFLRMALHTDPASSSTTGEAVEGDSPRNQFHLRSYLDLPHQLQLDGAWYYVDSLANQGVSSYTRVDLRLGWMPLKNLDLSVVVQNVLDPVHEEFGNASPLVTPTEIERSIYGKVTWQF